MGETRIIASRYAIGSLLGQGGMGDVYLGLDTHTGQPVAIKALHESVVHENPNIVDRFQREAEALRRLDHPNIVKILAPIEEDGQHYLVMEYISSGSLRDLIDREGRQPVERVLNIALDMADALARAHRLHIIHRDIKPDNVLLAEDGTPRLTDFGVAHLGGRTRLTQTGSVIGTYAYLSPEACNGEDLDERTDIWSFGIMLYEMLAGRPPFDELSTAAMLASILTRPAPDLTRLRPDLPPALADLIASMLEKDRARRISSVRLVGAELEALIHGLDTPLRERVVGPQGTPTGTRFATPPDYETNVPAMVRNTPGRSHGLSLYPAPDTPGIPGSGEAVLPRQNAWKWITVIIAMLLIAGTVISVAAIVFWFGDTGSSPGPITPAAQTSDQPALVEPVAANEYMVLVAQLEEVSGIAQLSGMRPRDVTRFLADDLQQTLEVGVPFSAVRIRAYPGVITSAEQAQAAAAANGATIVIWGNYTPDLIEVEIQVGMIDHFPHISIPGEMLDRTANVRLHLSDERHESVAPYVLGVLGILQDADGDGYDAMRTMAILDQIDVTSAQPASDTVAAYAHRAFQALLSDETKAVAEIDAGLALDPGNPILYTLRNVANQRRGDRDAARRDAQTAQRLGPADWTMPMLLLANYSANLNDVLEKFGQVIALHPEDWYPVFLRGTIYYSLGQWDPARADLEQAIALKPDANFPYIFYALLSLREGRVADAVGAIQTIVMEFPDPTFMQRLISATFGEQSPSEQSIAISAFTNLVLGRYDEAINDTLAGITYFPGYVDLYLMQGYAYCALGNYRDAEVTYSNGISVDPDFSLAYLMRAEVRMKRRNLEGTAQDLQTVQDSPVGAAFAPLAEAIQHGELGCDNFLSPTNPFFQMEATGVPVVTETPAN